MRDCLWPAASVTSLTPIFPTGPWCLGSAKLMIELALRHNRPRRVPARCGVLRGPSHVDPPPSPLLPSYVCPPACARSWEPHHQEIIMPAIKFRGVDFIQYDSLLTDEERLVRDSTRQFIEDNLVPIIEECNRAGRFPRELVKPMAEMGFFGASLKGYGCAGMGNVEYGLMTQELERGDSGVRSFVSVQSGLVMYPIYAFGSDEQKDMWLPAMQKGEKLGC